MSLNIQQIARALGGDVSGREVLCPGPGHSREDRSLSVRLDPNAPGGFMVNSFANDDPIVCRDYVREHAGLGDFKPQKGRQSPPESLKKKTALSPSADAVPVTPVPANAPSPPTHHPQFGIPRRSWIYRDGAGRALLTVMRFDRPDGGKELRPLSLWRLPDGRLEWRWASLPAPRPLYRLDRLAESPDDPVIVCEGEKDADAAAGLFPDHVVVTSPSGAKSANKADWSPLAGRKVTIWPDADAAGAAYAADVVRMVQERGGTVSVVDAARLAAIDPATGGQRAVSAGWGAADAVVEWSDHGALRAALVSATTPIANAMIREQKFALEHFGNINFDIHEEWLIKKILPKCGVAAIYGKPGSYKSFVAIDAAIAIATGSDWGGRRVSQGSVVYVAAEGSSGLRKRVAGLRRARDLPASAPFHLISAAPDLGSQQGDLEQLIAAINGAGVNPALIVIDTLSRTLNSADENGAGMVQFVANASELARRFGALVLVVHHSGLSDDARMRGHSSLHGAMDATILCERKDGGMDALLRLQKVKDETGDIALAATLERVVLGRDKDGDEISTLVVSSVREEEVRGGKSKGTSTPPFLRLLVELVGEAVMDSGQTIRPWSEGPAIRAAPIEAVRALYEKRKPLDETKDLAKARDNRRRAFSGAVEKAIDRKLVISANHEGRSLLWLPERAIGPSDLRTCLKTQVRSGPVLGSDNGVGLIRTRSDLVRSGPVSGSPVPAVEDCGEELL